jgi:uncharacterized protein YjbI with pentapeptide repeats
MTQPMSAKQALVAHPRYAAVQRQSFDGADLPSVQLPQVRLTRCSFRGADLRHATLGGCRFKLCDFHGADLRGTSVRGTVFAGCDLTDVDLCDTDLTGAEFVLVLTGTPPHGLTDVTGIRLDNAVLRDARLEQVIGWPDGDRLSGALE